MRRRTRVPSRGSSSAVSCGRRVLLLITLLATVGVPSFPTVSDLLSATALVATLLFVQTFSLYNAIVSPPDFEVFERGLAVFGMGSMPLDWVAVAAWEPVETNSAMQTLKIVVEIPPGVESPTA